MVAMTLDSQSLKQLKCRIIQFRRNAWLTSTVAWPYLVIKRMLSYGIDWKRILFDKLVSNRWYKWLIFPTLSSTFWVGTKLNTCLCHSCKLRNNDWLSRTWRQPYDLRSTEWQVLFTCPCMTFWSNCSFLAAHHLAEGPLTCYLS